MYYKPDTQQVFKDHSDIRNSLLYIFFPEVMDDEMLAYHKVFPLVDAKPVVTLPLIVKPAAIEEVDGVYTQQWEVVEATEEEIESLKPAVPHKVVRRQARQALMLRGLLGSVPSAIAAIPDATQRAMVEIFWEDSLEFFRDNPYVVSIGNAIGLDAAEMDELFIFAATL